MRKLQSHSSLPENYVLDYSINLDTDKKMMILLNVMSLVMILPFALGIILYNIFSQSAFEFRLYLTDALITVVGFLVIIMIHEFIHGIFFKLGTDEKVNYKFHIYAFSASVKGVYFYKKHYLLTGLAPFIIITPILILLMFLLPAYAYMIYLVIAIHTSGCIGDFYVAYKVLKYPKEALIEDYGVGMNIYKKQ